MMNLIKKMLVAGCIAAAICGCKKDTPAPDDYLSYKVDGVYKSVKPDADFIDGDLLIDGGKIGGEDLSIFVDDYPGPGRYNLTDSTYTLLSYHRGTGSHDVFYAVQGTLVIASYDGKQISGTFEFKGSNGQDFKTITEGKFKTKVDDLGYSSPADSINYINVRRGQLLRHLKLMKAGS